MRISDWSSDVCSSDLKDRMSCLAVTRALDVGATMIVAASSGNGGASLALYAAAAGLQCCIVTTSALSPVFRRAIIMTGAQIVTASDSLERWDHIANMVKEQRAFQAPNYPYPPRGSKHFGLDGFKTLENGRATWRERMC